MKLVLRALDSKYAILDLDMGKHMVSVTHLKPQQSTQGHSHKWEECYYFAVGIGEMQVGHETDAVSMGEFRVIKTGVFHRVFNKSLMTLTFVCVWAKKRG